MTTEILERKPALADRFEVIQNLGSGAAGSVYLVKDRKLGGQKVALKVLTNTSAFDEHTLTRFREEIRALFEVRHPNIIQAYELIESDDVIAFTMEYVPGCDLGTLFQERSIELQEIDHIFKQLLSALAELHKIGIVHRDLKLENILIRNDGLVKLSDLGLMKRMDGAALTKTGILLGTAQYLPPEYIKGSSDYDQRGDIYAVGVMLFELLTGKRRLADKPGMQAIEELIRTKFEVPKMALGGLPRKYVQIVYKAMEPIVSKRFQSVTEMQEAFDSDGLELSSQGPDAPLKEEIRLKDIRQRQHWSKVYARRVRKSKILMTLLFVSVVAVVFYFAREFFQRQLILEAGKYRGVITEVNGAAAKPIEVRVDQRGMFFELGLSGCQGGYLSRFNQIIDCGRPGIRLEYSGPVAEGHAGFIRDTMNGKVYKLLIKASQAIRASAAAK